MLDLRSGYWQVKIAPENTAFATHSGLYEFVVMPFGLCNALQWLMERMLDRDIYIVYLDDILVMRLLKNICVISDVYLIAYVM